MAALCRAPLKVYATSSGTKSGEDEPAPKKTPQPPKQVGSKFFPIGLIGAAARSLPLQKGYAPKLDNITSGYPEGIPVIFPKGSTPYQNPEYINTPWPNWKDAQYLNLSKKTPEDIAWIAESEVIHGRWAMLGCAGAWGAEVGTGVPWFKAGALCTPSDCTALNTIFPGQVIPIAPGLENGPSFWAVVAIEIAVFGIVEAYRGGYNKAETPNTPWNKDKVKTWEQLVPGDVHPGGVHFDPLNLAEKFDLQEMKIAELKHARLAMISWLGYMAQAYATNGASLGPLQPHEIEGAVGPYANWQAHIADPVHENVWKYGPVWNDQFLGILDN